MLYAIRKTPLHARLLAEGRIDPSDTPECGTNIIPLKMDRQTLRDGYVRVMTELYSTENYFERLEALFLEQNLKIAVTRAKYWAKHPWDRVKNEAIFLAQAIGLFSRLMTQVPEAYLRKEYRRRLVRFLKVRRNPGALVYYIIHMAQHYHAHTMAKQMASGRTGVYNSY